MINFVTANLIGPSSALILYVMTTAFFFSLKQMFLMNVSLMFVLFLGSSDVQAVYHTSISHFILDTYQELPYGIYYW